jgi:hypothetical protein
MLMRKGITDSGNSRMSLFLTLRYRNDEHSANRAGKVVIRLCESARLSLHY